MDIRIQHTDFLLDPPDAPFDYIVANPPFSRYSSVATEKRNQYREEFRSATGSFNLYVPFVEQMQRLLADDGTLVFLAPVGYLLSDHTSDFRDQLRRDRLEEFMLLPMDVFAGVEVEPVVTSLSADSSLGRDGHFWIESFFYQSRVDDLLRDVGVTDSEKQEVRREAYYESYEIVDRLLRRKQQRNGENGGYNEAVIPAEYRPNDSHQADIGRWSG